MRADGEFVGLPAGQMGNSEVGHLNLGAGRIVYQDLSKINNAIKDGTFFKNERFLAAIEHAKKNDSALHIYGLVSTGGVHSSLDHLLALIKMAAENGLAKVYVHAFLDGRDTPPQSACEFLQVVEDELKNIIFLLLQQLLVVITLWTEIIVGTELKKVTMRCC